jgi:hypothetical protein
MPNELTIGERGCRADAGRRDADRKDPKRNHSLPVKEGTLHNIDDFRK